MKSKISYRVFGGGSSTIIIRASAKYAQFHNDPTGTWRKNKYSTESATQRQFIGNSNTLEKWIQKRLEKALTYTFA